MPDPDADVAATAQHVLDQMRGLTEAPIVVCITIETRRTVTGQNTGQLCGQPAVGTMSHGASPVCEEHFQVAERSGIHVARHGFVAAGQDPDAAARALLRKVYEVVQTGGELCETLIEVEQARARWANAIKAVLGEG